MKKLLLPLIAAVLWLSKPLCAASAAEGFTYTLIGDEVTVTGYSGKPEVIDIPQYIEGKPVTEVRDNAFWMCTTLRQISLPATVRTMGHHCFYGCSGLEEIILPPQLESLGMGCFGECTSLDEITLPDTLEVLPDSCFRGCTSLETIVIPQSVTNIEKFCFCRCSSLCYASPGGRLSEIGTGAFYMCEKLDNIYIPPSVERLGAEALGYTAGGERVKLTIIGAEGSAAEEYAEANGIVFSSSPETVQTFDPADSENAPVKLPPSLAAAGGGLFLLAGGLALRQYLIRK